MSDNYRVTPVTANGNIDLSIINQNPDVVGNKIVETVDLSSNSSSTRRDNHDIYHEIQENSYVTSILTTDELIRPVITYNSDKKFDSAINDGKINGIIFPNYQYEQIEQNIATYEEQYYILQGINEYIESQISNLDLGFNPTLNRGAYENLKIDLARLGLRNDDIVYVPYIDDEENNKYYHLTIYEFAEYVAATDNGYKFFNEDSDGNLVFNYSMARIAYSGIDRTHITDYNKLNEQYEQYEQYRQILIDNNILMKSYEDYIELAGYYSLAESNEFSSFLCILF